MSDTHATAHIDGGSRGNPGPAAYAVVLERPGEPVVEICDTIGSATNNVAEYSGLLAALDLASELGVKQLAIVSDSELLVKQMNGEYKVKSPELQELFAEALVKKRQFTSLTLSHVRREQNKRADKLCNDALDGHPKPRNRSAAAVAKPSSPEAAKPITPTSSVVGDAAVRDDCIAILTSAAQSWAQSGPQNPPVGMIWDQIWSVLADGGVLKKTKK